MDQKASSESIQTSGDNVIHYWIEKTIVTGRPDRESGDHALGKALWSPQRSKNGGDIYKTMREVKPGDIVYHLTDNSGITGVSVAGSFDDTFVGLASTDWAGRPGYRISLSKFQKLEPKVDRTWFLDDLKYADRLKALLAKDYRLFYSTSLDLNQGAYLTEAPMELVNILNEAYRDKTGLNLPYIPSEPTLSPQDKLYNNMLSDFVSALAESGIRVSSDTTTRLLSGLLAKPFLILTGLSGSGKTKLAHAVASWLSKVADQYRLIAVGADWTSNENVLGFQDALQPTIYRKPASGALDLILRAEKDPEHPFFLILDEMNLSHVERYFADILSTIETGQEIALHSSDKPLESFFGDPLPVPPRLRLPNNLFIIGTVNIDETTYMFSPKVLDRANVIEFRATADEIAAFLESPGRVDMEALAGKGAGYGRAFVSAAQNEVSLINPAPEFGDSAAAADKLKKQLSALFTELAPIGAEFGFRTALEVSRFFYHYAVLTGTGWQFKDALDAQIIQKLMPKLHGSDRKLRPTLEKLKTFCEAQDLKLSLAKTERMLERITQDGFTSFAEA